MTEARTDAVAETPRKGRIMVTGANSGLGFEAAAQLAEAGFEPIVLAARRASSQSLASSPSTPS